MAADPLRKELRRLARKLDEHGIRLIVGGGYGLLLRTEHIRLNGARTRFEELPGTRSTDVVDIFLGAEIITNPAKTSLIRAALDELGYKPVEGALYYQFVQPIEYAGLPRGVKIDLLAAPVAETEVRKVKQDERRIRPLGAKGLHAHTTPEALTVEDHALSVDIGEDETQLLVYVPHPFSYLLLKLFALRDQLDNEEKKYGAYHAFDIYRTIGMMTAEEWEEALSIRRRFLESEPVVEAGILVRELFANLESPGMIRLRDHARTIGESLSPENLRDVISDLHELLAEKQDAS
jgi:hypothetical protein